VHAVPVVFHNMSGYDAHFIIRKLSTLLKGTVKLLPINKEKYIYRLAYLYQIQIFALGLSIRFVLCHRAWINFHPI
jgi:hypothetical protein